jgi:hypothetical protein
MRTVRMIVTLSGGGPGDRDWRDYPAGASLEVEDWEAEDLIRIGLAVPGPEGGSGRPAMPEPAAEVPAGESEPAAGAAAAPDTGVSPLAEVSPLAQAAVTGAGTVPPGEPADETGPPAPHDAKRAWIDWAITRGADPDTAAAMTKADLMSRYGGRL